MILDSIHSPADVRELDQKQLPQLCRELRQFLLENVSKTGGHLASNLGVVELTVAIHRVFDTAQDRLVFDVGHQSYVHKALTGRQALFSTLRQLDGLSGFPKPYESVHDSFIAGHASNSVSVALGMARARTLQQENYQVLALIGDGALTGGLAYEGLNNAGASGEHLIVILNDNGMSIDPNVGAIPDHLTRLRSKPAYYRFKKWYRSLFGETPAKSALYRFNHRLKTSLKKSIWPGSTLFEDMGFTYLGPIDGHDLPRLCDVLSWAKELNGPVLVHVHTRKGKGYSYAERDPGKFHGISPFDPETGLLLKRGGETFSTVFGKALTDCAAKDSRICAITAAMEDGTGLTPFAKAYPSRFFDVGIAEGHGVSMAAGMAKQGMIPVFAVYSTFLQRSYDMLVHDAALQKLHIVLGVDRAGIPGFTVLCPASFAELRAMIRQALFEIDGPVAIRYPRGGEGGFTGDTSARAAVRLKDGSNALLISYGTLTNQALEAAEQLEKEGISTKVLKLNRIAPLDMPSILQETEGMDAVLILEDCFENGSVGQQIAAGMAEAGQRCSHVILQNLKDHFAPAGSVEQLRHRFGLDAGGAANAVRKAMAYEQ